VVVFNLTRSARDKYDHFALRSLLHTTRSGRTRVQAILSGCTVDTMPRQQAHRDFPLRWTRPDRSLVEGTQ